MQDTYIWENYWGIILTFMQDNGRIRQAEIVWVDDISGDSGVVENVSHSAIDIYNDFVVI